MRWLPVVGYEGLYEVSDTGLVRSLPHKVARRHWKGEMFIHRLRGRRLKPHPGNGQGTHLAVSLSKDGKVKRCQVHRLVLEAFVGPPPNGQECCHFDGKHSNNLLANLRWGTRAENAGDMARHGSKKGEKHHGAKLTNAKVRRIRRAYADGAGISELAERYGVTHTTIGGVVRRRLWKHIH